jgi:hypothetical protein
MKAVLQTGFFLVLCVANGACGSDDDPPMASGGTGGTGGAASETGGTAGTAGGGTGGAGGSTASVPCGSQTCTAEGLIAMFGGQACCADASAGVCGTSMGGGACMPPRDSGMPDARCTPPPGGSPLPLMGCCTNEMCGLDLSVLQQGCIEYSELAGLGAMFGMGGGGLMLPTPRRCDAPPPETDTDAGSE